MGYVHGTWKRIIDSDSIRRSSQVVGIVNRTLLINGGELNPREPVDNQVYCINLGRNPNSVTIHSTEGISPSPRIGAAFTSGNDAIYLHSGRGGPAMAPIDEAGAIWSLEFSSNTSIWSLIKPVDPQAPFPEPRSYHAMAFDGRESIYLHAGCPEKGRLSDLWAFHLGRKSWKQLALAPEPARGGTSIAYETQSAKLYRMNGFDGQKEQGGTVDVYDVAGDSWSTVPFTADGLHGPEARSVSTLACTKVQGKKQLVTMFGERDPSSLGHAGAGKMLSDVWIWDLQDKVWSKVAIDNESGSPAARGWFAADVVKDEPDTGSIIVHGGLAEDNTRLGDVWLLQF